MKLLLMLINRICLKFSNAIYLSTTTTTTIITTIKQQREGKQKQTNKQTNRQAKCRVQLTMAWAGVHLH